MEILSDKWMDYEILDAGEGEKLERWGNVVLRRPDPQCLWPKDPSVRKWNSPDAHYHRSAKGGGNWEYRVSVPESWNITYGDLKFKVSPTGFKHTGIFPEQAANWDWAGNMIRNADRPIRVLNLFAYTGGATVACAKAGAAEVVHVDAAKGMVNWAKDNIAINGLSDSKVRFIVDDVMKFVAREARRGRTYQAIIMDPPSYGRGPNGEMWKLEDQLPGLIDACMQILDPDPLFLIVNSYTTGYSTVALRNLIRLTLGKKYPGYHAETGNLCIPIGSGEITLPCGMTARFYK